MKTVYRAVCIASVLISGCTLMRTEISSPNAYQVERDQLVIHSDFRLAKRHRLLDELVARRLDLADKLQLPLSDEPIYVFLFDSPSEYHEFIAKKYPSFPDRRAFFVETDTRLKVYAYWGDRVGEDLRHEVTHGYLHAVLTNLPLWLDEGFAEYFEVPRGQRGVNAAHVELLAEQLKFGKWFPDMAQLEKLERPEQMSQQDYAESWLWAHWLLETTDPRLDLLRNHVARMRLTGETPSLSVVVKSLEPNAPQLVADHLRSLLQSRTLH